MRTFVLLANLASQSVRVVQSGEGADELFAGYQTYGFHTNSKFIRVIAQGLKKLPKGTRYNLGRKIGKMKISMDGSIYMNHLLLQKNILSVMLECSKNQKHQKC